MSAFDDLQSQLLKSVERRANARATRAGSRRARYRRGTRSRGGLMLVAVPLVFAAAAAAATIVTQSGESPADRLFNRVLTLTHTGSMTGPCEVVGGRRRASLSSEATDPRITAVLPALATAPQSPPRPRVLAMIERDSGGSVLARTIREVRFPGGITLIVWVTHGGLGGASAVDPQRCRAARLAKLAELRPDAHDPLRRSVARMIEDMPDTDGLQSLSLFHRQAGSAGGGGASIPLIPGHRTLSTGVMFSGSSCTPRKGCSPIIYGGIAGPAAAYLTISPAPNAPPHSRHVHRRVAVEQGLFAFTLPRDTGPEIVTRRAHDGRALSAERLGR